MDFGGVTVEDIKELLGSIPEEEEEDEDEEVQKSNALSHLRPLPQRRSSARSLGSDSDDEDDEEEDDEEEDEEEEFTSEEEEETDDRDSDWDAAELEAELDAEEAEEEYLAKKLKEEEKVKAKKNDLINEYIRAKAVLKYQKKRNAFFQDRIYRTSVRKGILVESEMDKEEERRKAKKHKKAKKHGRRHRRKQRMLEHEREVLENEEDPQNPDAEKEKEKEKEKAKSKEKKSKPVKGQIALQLTKDKKAKGFGEAFANEVKYQKLIQRIIRILSTQEDYSSLHEQNLLVHENSRKDWKRTHSTQFNKLMESIKLASDCAVDSSTGFRIPKFETEKYVQEMTRIHEKLCATLIKMFKTRRGLELSMMRLNESEVQGGEGLQMLEYEQLRVENQQLKDKLSDRLKDVDNIKDKISHAIQILAHFRQKMFHTTQMIRDKQEELNGVNAEVYVSRERTEQANMKFLKLRKEEQTLVVDSGLLDNSTLLRDYEKTHFDVLSLQEQKRKLARKLQSGTREIHDIRDKIDDIKTHFPEIFANKLELEKLKKKKKKQTYIYESPYKRPTS